MHPSRDASNLRTTKCLSGNQVELMLQHIHRPCIINKYSLAWIVVSYPPLILSNKRIDNPIKLPLSSLRQFQEDEGALLNKSINDQRAPNNNEYRTKWKTEMELLSPDITIRMLQKERRAWLLTIGIYLLIMWSLFYVCNLAVSWFTDSLYRLRVFVQW